MSDKKIFFFDIDGTLAIGKTIPESTKTALKKLKNLGYYLFICTGRPYQYAFKYFQKYVDGFISSNGRYIVYHNDVIVDKPLTQEQIRYFVRVMRKHHCGFAFLNHDHGYLESDNQDIIQKSIESYYPGYYLLQFDDCDIQGYMFDIYCRDAFHLQKVQKELKDMIIFNRHYPFYSADATILGIDKGYGIDQVLDYFHISLKNAYAFGDGTNDICMFSHVGHSIAMGNAIDILKEKAEYVTTSIHEDGIYKALQYYQIID